MVEGICGVVVGYGQRQAIRAFLAVADGVVLVGAVSGVEAAVGADDLAEWIVAPSDAAGG